MLLKKTRREVLSKILKRTTGRGWVVPTLHHRIRTTTFGGGCMLGPRGCEAKTAKKRGGGFEPRCRWCRRSRCRARPRRLRAGALPLQKRIGTAGEVACSFAVEAGEDGPHPMQGTLSLASWKSFSTVAEPHRCTRYIRCTYTCHTNIYEFR